MARSNRLIRDPGEDPPGVHAGDEGEGSDNLREYRESASGVHEGWRDLHKKRAKDFRAQGKAYRKAGENELASTVEKIARSHNEQAEHHDNMRKGLQKIKQQVNVPFPLGADDNL